MRNHKYKLFEIVLVGVGVGGIVESFYIYLPFLYEIPFVVVVHVLVAGILEGEPYETLGLYLRETHFRCFLLELCQQLSYLYCWLDVSVELLKVFAVLCGRGALDQIVEIFEIIRVLYYFCYSLQLADWVVEMFAFEYISFLHLQQSLVEKWVVGCDYHLWSFVEDVEEFFCYSTYILGRVMGQLQKGKAVGCESVLLGETCEGDNFPEFYAGIMRQFFPDNAILYNIQVADPSVPLKIALHFGVDHHEEVRTFLGCIIRRLYFGLGVEVVKIWLEPVLPVEVVHFHDLVFEVGVYPSEAGEAFVHGMSEVVHLVLFTFLVHLVEQLFPLISGIKFPLSDRNLLKFSRHLQILIGAIFLVVVTVVKVGQFQLVVRSGAQLVPHYHFWTALPAENFH